MSISERVLTIEQEAVCARETVGIPVAAPPKCVWKEAAEDLDSTLFKAIKAIGPSDSYHKCLNCQGHDYKCAIYQEFLYELQ